MGKGVRGPDFLIVGTMKSGTSTLADSLDLHKQIYLSPEEIHFFDNDKNYGRGREWYSCRLFADCNLKVKKKPLLIGEKTPTYSYQPNCAARIAAVVPNVQLIWIFRNPIKRTISNYLHARKKGADLLSFQKAIEKESERMEKNIFKGYSERSKYALQVDRFLKYFTVEQMHFMLFEDLLRSPQNELNKVASFLSLPPFADRLHQQHSNKTVMPFSPLTLWCAKSIFGYNNIIYKMIYRFNCLFPKEKPEIPAEIIKQLEILFEPYNKRLQLITGLNLEAWKL